MARRRALIAYAIRVVFIGLTNFLFGKLVGARDSIEQLLVGQRRGDTNVAIGTDEQLVMTCVTGGLAGGT